jgi:hypothetical protein
MYRRICLILVLGLLLISCTANENDQADQSSSSTETAAAPNISPAEGFKLVSSNLQVVDTSANTWSNRFTLNVLSESEDDISLKTRLRVLDSIGNILYEEIIRGLALPTGTDTTYSGIIMVPADSIRKFHSFSVDMAREIE